MKRHLAYHSLFVAFILCATTSASFALQNAGPQRGVFLYGADQHGNSKMIEELGALGINRIYMRVKTEWLTHKHEKMQDLVSWAHEKDIKVYAVMLEQPDVVYEAMHLKAIDEIKKLIEYCKRMRTENPSAVFDGFMVDAQPHKLFRGGDNYGKDELERREELMEGYEDLLRELKRTVKASGIPLEISATTAWWYNEQGQDNILPSAKANKLARQADMVVPLVFGGIGVTADDIIKKTEDEIKKASTMIAVGAAEFASFESLMKAIEAIEDKFKNRSKFEGVVIYHYGTLMARYGERF